MTNPNRQRRRSLAIASVAMLLMVSVGIFWVTHISSVPQTNQLLSSFGSFHMRGKQQQHQNQKQHEEHQGALGGYSGINSKKQILAAVAQFAVKSLLELDKSHDNNSEGAVWYSFSNDKRMDLQTMDIEVLDAKQQVVEGMNYSLQIAMRSSGECLGAFNVDVWDRFGDMTVTRWGQEISCDSLLGAKDEDVGV